jgi:hypothetical protein
MLLSLLMLVVVRLFVLLLMVHWVVLLLVVSLRSSGRRGRAVVQSTPILTDAGNDIDYELDIAVSDDPDGWRR